MIGSAEHVMCQPAVRCRDVVKDFGKGNTRTRALNGVDFDARLGEITFVVGPSGSGKTTLLSIITGMLSADVGVIDVLGTQLAQLRQSELTVFRGERIGFVLQQFNLLPGLNSAENVAVPLIVQGWRRRRAKKVAADLLQKLGLSAQTQKYPEELSTGQQQRVAIARALVHNPRLIVCDEPTSALDAESGIEVMGLLRELALEPDRAIIVVSHDDRIIPFADRIAVMSEGRIEQTNINDQRGMIR